MKRVILDIETNNLLQKGLDYSSLPYKLKPDYHLWCIVLRDIDSDKVVKIVQRQCTKKVLQEQLADCTMLIGHNIIGFDLPVLMLLGVLDYEVGYPDDAYPNGDTSSLFGKPVMLYDTLIWSKLLNPDRYGGHGLAAWGERLGNPKIEFSDYSKYTPEMLVYCEQDTATNKSVFFSLEREKGDWAWQRSYNMEVKLVDITLKQELFGFNFNVEKANACIVELDTLLLERAERVNPLVPPRRLTKGEQKYYTPPKIQFKQDSTVSAVLLKWCDKVGATLEGRVLTFEGATYNLPYNEPVKLSEESDIEDINNLKGYLLDLGWRPSEWKERDLTKNADKAQRTIAEVHTAIQRYIDETEESEYREARCKILECRYEDLRTFLVSKINGTKPLRVPTTPCLRVGVEKELCPMLEKLGEQANFVQDVVEYFTYRHRRNSIAGGKMDEDGEPITGFLAHVREDGRIPTPANTLGTNTGRYRHSIVVNVPRVSSIYGAQLRSLFGSGHKLYQLGWDFSSLEARIQGHYCIPYTRGRELSETLLAKKPFDLHSLSAKRYGIERDGAKSVNYAIIFGSQAAKVSKMLGVSLTKGREIYNSFWEGVPALKELKDRLEAYWGANGKTFILGIDGRKLVTRSKHSLVNVCFQSGGAISGKWSTVFITQEMEEAGILGNPFIHSEKDVKVWQMIVNHDEVQYAIHPSLLDIKAYKDGDDKPEGCSAVQHGTKGDYIAHATSPVFAIEDGVARACNELKLRVELGFEWCTGLDWGACH